jgi:excisionase family DNA binding protein
MRRENERLTYKIEEAGRLLGIGRNQAYEAARRGDFPVIKIGKRMLVPKAALDRMLAGGEAA